MDMEIIEPAEGGKLSTHRGHRPLDVMPIVF